MMAKLNIFILIALFSSGCFSDSTCLENAKKYERLAGAQDEMNGEYMQKAQDYYLCAEKEGDTFSGFKAASFSEGGVAKTLPEKEVFRLILNAANAGNTQAMFVMSRLSCDLDDSGKCRGGAESKMWLIKVAQSGNCDGYTFLGRFYEVKSIDEIDLKRAASCYKKASDCGSELGKTNFERVKKLVEITGAPACI